MEAPPTPAVVSLQQQRAGLAEPQPLFCHLNDFNLWFVMPLAQEIPHLASSWGWGHQLSQCNYYCSSFLFDCTPDICPVLLLISPFTSPI